MKHTQAIRIGVLMEGRNAWPLTLDSVNRKPAEPARDVGMETGYDRIVPAACGKHSIVRNPIGENRDSVTYLWLPKPGNSRRNYTCETLGEPLRWIRFRPKALMRL